MPNSLQTDPNQLAMYRCLTCKYSCDKRDELDYHFVNPVHAANVKNKKRTLTLDYEETANDDEESPEYINAAKRIKSISSNQSIKSPDNNTNSMPSGSNHINTGSSISTISIPSNTSSIIISNNPSINNAITSPNSSTIASNSINSSSNIAVTIRDEVPMMVNDTSDILTNIVVNNNESNKNYNYNDNIVTTTTSNNNFSATNISSSSTPIGNGSFSNYSNNLLHLNYSDIHSAFALIDSVLENSSLNPLSSSSSSPLLNTNSSNIIANNFINCDGFEMVTNSAGQEVIVTKDIEQAIILPSSERNQKEIQVLYQLQQQQQLRQQSVENKSNDFNDQLHEYVFSSKLRDKNWIPSYKLGNLDYNTDASISIMLLYILLTKNNNNSI